MDDEFDNVWFRRGYLGLMILLVVVSSPVLVLIAMIWSILAGIGWAVEKIAWDWL